MDKKLLEKLAALEHDQWVEWSKELAEKEPLSQDRVIRWNQYWRPYADLSDSVKEFDRKWARKAVAIMENHFRPKAELVTPMKGMINPKPAYCNIKLTREGSYSSFAISKEEAEQLYEQIKVFIGK